MKILITTDIYTDSINGVITSVTNLIDELQKRGHEVRVLTFSRYARKSYTEGNVTYIKSVPLRIYENVRMPISLYPKLLKEIVAWHPDVIHSQCEMFSYRYALYVSKKTQAPIVHTYHTMYEDYVGYVFFVKKISRFIVRKYTKYILEKANSVIVPTEKVKNKHLCDGVRSDFQVVPSGIDLSRHMGDVAEEEILSLKDKLGIPKEAKVLINLGRLGAEKNINELISLVSKVCLKYENTIFLIVGDGPERQRLEQEAKDNGIADRVIFTGMIPPEEVHKYYRLGDVFISASTSETQGLTYIEAAANGLPLVCRSDECLNGIIIDGENGFEYKSDEDFLCAIDKIFTDKNLSAKFGGKSREIASIYSKASFADSVERIYKAVIEETNKEALKKG